MADPDDTTESNPAPPATVTTCPVCGTRYAGLATCPTCASAPPVQHAPLAWFLPTATAAAGLAFGSAHLPGRVKLLVLFLMGVGVAIGAVSGCLAQLYYRTRPRIVLGVTFALTAFALVGTTLESHRLWAKPIREQRRDAARKFFGEPDALREQAARKLDEVTSLRTYLVRRVAQLGDWSGTAATLFLAFEVLLGAIAAAWTTHVMLRPASVATHSQ